MHLRQRLSFAAAVALTATLLLAAVPAAGATSLAQAQRTALAALGVRGGDRPVVVFRERAPLPPGTRITTAGPTRLPRGGADGARPRAPRLRAAGVTVVRAPVVARVGREPAWFFYADHGPHQAHQHRGQVVLVGVRSGRATRSRLLTWPPLIDGRLPRFLRSPAAYRSPRARAFARPYRASARPRATPARGAAGPRSPGAPFPSGPVGLDAIVGRAAATAAERAAAAQLGAGRSCAVRVAGTHGRLHAATALDRTGARLAAIFARLGRLDGRVATVRYRAASGMTLPRFVSRLIDRRGCRDVLLHVAGAGWVTGGEPAITVGARARRDGRVEHHVVTAGALRALLAAHRSVTFHLLIDAPGAGRFAAALRRQPNLIQLLAAARAGQPSFAALPPLRLGRRRLANRANPAGLLEFTNRAIRGLTCFLQRPDEVDAAARAVAERRAPSFSAWMVRRALALCQGGSLLDRLRGAPTPLLASWGFAVTAPDDGRPGDDGGPAAPPSGGRPGAPDGPPSGGRPVDDAPDGPPSGDGPGDGAPDGPPSGDGPGDGDPDRSDEPTPGPHRPPVVDAGGGRPRFVLDGPPVAIAPELAVTAVDDGELVRATVRIADGYAGAEDQLRFTDRHGITGAYRDGTLTLTGVAPVAAYQAALRSVAYENVAAADPSTGPRTVAFTASSAAATSAPATTTVTVVRANRPPTVDDAAVAAVGNTLLAYGTAVPAGQPGLAVAGNLLANAVDPDGDGPLAIDVAASDPTGDRGGEVSWRADGTFTYVPPAGFTGTETLTYRVTDQRPDDPAVAVGRVVVTVAERVFYVRNDADPGGDGRSHRPFRTLAAAAAAADAAGDRIYVHRGDGTPTGLGADVALLDGQQLLGERADLVVAGATLHAAAAGEGPTVAGAVRLGARGAVAGLDLRADGAGAAITAAPGATDGTIRDVAVNAAGAADGLVLAGTGGRWTVEGLRVRTVDGTGIALAGAGAVAFPAAAETTVVAAGAGSALDIAATALSGELDAVATAATTAVQPAVRLVDTTGALAIAQLSVVADGPGLLLDNAAGVEVDAPAGAVRAGGTAVAIRATSGTPATRPRVRLGTVTSTGGPNGIVVVGDGAAGLAVDDGALSGHSDAAIAIDGGWGEIAYGGAIGDGPGLSVRITGRRGGAITLSGPIADGPDPGGGIAMSGNIAGSTTFSGPSTVLRTGAQPAVAITLGGDHRVAFLGGGLAIETTSGAGFTATGPGGSVTVQGAGNVIDAGSGTALRISGPAIAAGDVTFQRISSDGAPSGIVLAGTGAAGGLRVTGTGAPGSGGTIRASTGPGIALTDAADVRLASLEVIDGADDGIRGTDVAGFALTGATVAANGDAVGEHGLDFTNLTGAVRIEDVAVTGSGARNLSVVNDRGTLTATVAGGRFADTASSKGGVGADGIFLAGDGDATMDVTVDGTELRDHRDDHIQVTAPATTRATQRVTIRDVTAVNAVGASGGGITLNPGGQARLTATVADSTIVGARAQAITVDTPGSRADPQRTDVRVTIVGNAIGDPAVPRSGASAGNGIGISANGNAAVVAHVEGNAITQYVNLAGVRLVANDGDGSLDATLVANRIHGPGSDGATSGQHGILGVFGGADALDRPTVCLDLRGNALAGAGSEQPGGEDVHLRHRDRAVVQIPGYAGDPGDLAAVGALIASRNAVDGTPSVGGPPPNAVDSAGFVGTLGGLPCRQP